MKNASFAGCANLSSLMRMAIWLEKLQKLIHRTATRKEKLELRNLILDALATDRRRKDEKATLSQHVDLHFEPINEEELPNLCAYNTKTT